MTTVDLSFSEPTADEVATLDQLVLPAGTRRLGDVVVRRGDCHAMPVRLFVESAGTTLGMTGTFLDRFMELCSFAANGEHVTVTNSCRKAFPFAAPPFVRRKGLVVKPADAVLAAHLSRISGLPDLRNILNLDDAKHELTQLQSREIAWRNAMDVDELLELDLRAYLGHRYDVLGPGMTRHLRELPGARVVSTP